MKNLIANSKEFDFITYASAKCVLVGEHVILRNGAAIVCPFKKFYSKLCYKKTNENIKWRFFSRTGHLLTNANTTEVDNFLQQKFGQLTGEIYVRSNIPSSAGLGSSAAFSLNIARLIHHLEKITFDDIFDLAKQIENLFHVISSGLDIAGIMNEHLLLYQSSPLIRKNIILPKNFVSPFYLSYCGIKSRTKEAAQQLEKMIKEDNEKFYIADRLMKDAVDKLYNSFSLLQNNNDGENIYLTSTNYLQDFSAAIDLAYKAFEHWELIGKKQNIHINALKNAGALSCKPTGSGIGGYVISLWPDRILAEKASKEFGLIPIKLI